jgi:hypothetical protein
MSGTTDGSASVFGDPGTGATNSPTLLLTVAVTGGMAVGQSTDLAIGPLYTQAFIGAVQDGYRNGMHTFCYKMTNFIGSIWIEGATVRQPMPADWQPIVNTTQTYTGLVNTDVINVQGDYQWLRLVVNLLAGSVDQVRYKG